MYPSIDQTWQINCTSRSIYTSVMRRDPLRVSKIIPNRKQIYAKINRFDDNKNFCTTTMTTPPTDTKKEEDAKPSESKEKKPQEQKQDGGNKKKRVIVTPPCPSSVATAYVLLRGVLLGIVGANRNDVAVNVFQPTYIKDKALTGKFSIGFGKKVGCGRLPLPTTPEGVAALYDAIEAAVARVLSSSADDAKSIATAKKAALEAYGTSVFDSLHKKLKDDAEVLLVFVRDLVLSYVPNSNNLSSGTSGATGAIASPSSIESITLDRGNLGCKVVAGEKARKAEVILKFTVQLKNPDNDSSTIPWTHTESPLEVIPQEAISNLETVQIRLPEGEQLLQNATATTATQKDEKTPAAAETTTTTATEADAKTTTTTTATEGDAVEEDTEMVVNAHEVKGKIDYNKLVDEFGSTLIDDKLLSKLTSLTVGRGTVPKLHRFIRRNIFFSHRDLDKLLSQLELKNGTMYLYTGRGPSSDAMHLGHLIPFLFTQWLQQAFDVPLVIQMTDDEKFLWKGVYDETQGEYNLDHYRKLTISNAKDIIACGFKYEKTFLFSDCDYVGRMYPNICKIWRAVTSNTVKNIFGFDGSSNIGQFAFPAIQAAPSFASSFPIVLNTIGKSDTATTTSEGDDSNKNNNKKDNIMCLIPCAIDQDPYFRMTRDIAHKMVKHDKQHGLNGKPALIHSKFFPPLQGSTGKMSSSDSNSAVFLTDSQEDIAKKIKEHAFSGGQDTKKLQQELGADLQADVSYQWLKFFLEDDEELEAIGKDYSTGSGKYWSTGTVKNRLIEVLQELVQEHQERRKLITDEEVRKWMTERNIA